MKKAHMKGIGCDSFYSKERDKRRCSCGRPGVGLTKNDSPVCSFHNKFPTECVKLFPAIPNCPGPHTK